MALNHILYRPQVLQHPISDSDSRLIEELMDMASRLFNDALKGGPAREKLFAGLNEAMTSLVQEVETRMATASASFKAWLAPIVQALETLINGMGGINSSAAGVHSVAKLILFLADIMESLKGDAIANKLNALLSIITDDLGLSKARLTAFLNDAVDIVAQKMKADFIAGTHTEQSHNEYLIGAYLEKVKGLVDRLFAEIEFELDLPEMIQKAVSFLENIDWERLRAAAQKILEDVGNTVESLGILMDIFSGKFNVTVTVTAEVDGPSAPNDPVSWYATWFTRVFGWTETVGVIDRDRLEDEDFFSTMSFKQAWLPPSTMEHLAHVSDIVADSLEAAAHVSSFNSYDWVGNTAHAGLNVVKALLSGLLADSDDEDWVRAHMVFGNSWIKMALQLGISMLTGMESAHLKAGDGQGIFWLTLVGKDATEALLYGNWVARIRQAILSFCTLMNADPLGVPTSQNHHKVEGFSMLVSEICSWLFALSSGPKGFGLPGHGQGKLAFTGWLLLGVGGSIVGASAGWFLSWLIAHSQQPEGTDADVTKPNGESYGWLLLESAVAGAAKQVVYQYFWYNGDTDNGQIGQDDNYNFKVYKGYPPKETSPYLMPYAQGETRQCAQTNNGVWSHHHNTGQIYAFDWDHDHGMDVLCVREGKVFDWRDCIPDHSTLTDNNIEIRHSRTHPDPIHDRDWKEDGIVTTAKYIHGAHYSVRHIFAARGIPKDNIAGTPINQGELVMFSGDTGISFYNHLHMHVSTENATSIPWVFGDADAPDNGVLKDLVWYESSNPLVQAPTGLTIAHPTEQETTVVRRRANVISTAPKKVVIDYPGSWSESGDFVSGGSKNGYKGLTIKWTMPNGQVQYQLVTGNDDQPGITPPTPFQAWVTIKNNWNPAPPAGQRFDILGLAGKTTSNTIILGPFARDYSDTYTGRYILVKWTTAEGETFYEYKKIQSYDTGERKVTIDGTWDRQPSEFSEYQIGGLSYSDSPEWYRRFAFVPGGPDNAPALPLHKTARVMAMSSEQPLLVPNPNQLKLAPSAPNVAAEVIGRPIAIYDQDPNRFWALVRAYTIVTNYDPVTKIVTVADPWPISINLANDFYVIGRPKHSAASQEEREAYAFICPDSTPGTYSPTDFGAPNVAPPYTSQTYKTW